MENGRPLPDEKGSVLNSFLKSLIKGWVGQINIYQGIVNIRKEFEPLLNLDEKKVAEKLLDLDYVRWEKVRRLKQQGNGSSAAGRDVTHSQVAWKGLDAVPRL